ncbi:hypothetical protein MNBD_GAMMA17-455, partial [hydrothermal vent metagenome]
MALPLIIKDKNLTGQSSDGRDYKAGNNGCAG